MADTPTARTRRPRVRRTGSPVRMPAVPWEKYPGARKNPALERAVRIHYATVGGMSRAEAVGLADQKAHKPEKVGRSRPASKPGGKSKR